LVDPQRGHPLLQGLTLGLLQISLSLIVNALIVIAAGSIASFLAHRPDWATWQRRTTGGLLGAAA
jgi:threonine/homoserine/homoserine lactone efflux protein